MKEVPGIYHNITSVPKIKKMENKIKILSLSSSILILSSYHWEFIFIVFSQLFPLPLFQTYYLIFKNILYNNREQIDDAIKQNHFNNIYNLRKENVTT